jgi:SAM-dependent methyltransferase
VDAQIYLDMRRVEDEHWWFVGRRAIVREAIAGLALARPRILDAGCGTGGNLAMLSGFGDVIGLELDPTAVAAARSRGAWRIERGGLPVDRPAWRAQFDLVVMTDVLEHIEDDAGALTSVAALLRPGGHLLLTVPAFRFLWSAHDTAHHHRRRYTAAGLRAAIARAGLVAGRVSYFNCVLFPAIAAVRLAGRFAGGAGGTPGLGLPAAPVNRALAALFAAERHVLRRAGFPFGVSILALATAPRRAATPARAELTSAPPPRARAS